jgi:hypothetical protein
MRFERHTMEYCSARSINSKGLWKWSSSSDVLRHVRIIFPVSIVFNESPCSNTVAIVDLFTQSNYKTVQLALMLAYRETTWIEIVIQPVCIVLDRERIGFQDVNSNINGCRLVLVTQPNAC